MPPSVVPGGARCPVILQNTGATAKAEAPE